MSETGLSPERLKTKLKELLIKNLTESNETEKLKEELEKLKQQLTSLKQKQSYRVMLIRKIIVKL